jgi:NADH dehydrogenase (ubiquinone) Fe-S protein 1
MINIKINNIELNLPNNITVLQACDSINSDVPRFCFHGSLEIAGNCRMCLVEIKNSPKPIASCALPISEGMEIFTSTPLVKKARESVLEFLLINHPLDCPVCDQGGECDLQDQTMKFGSDRSRFFFSKRSVENKNCGPFIKTIMTRCIHCTRCVRFANEICGIDNLGTTGRGNQTEISFYISKIFESEYSGNVIDLCPVGALTSKPFSFKARSWELTKHESIDILDGLGSNIIIQTFNNEIVRILPKNNDNINIEWISNKTRFFFDSLKYQRITAPLLVQGDRFVPVPWAKVYYELCKRVEKLDGSFGKVIFGDFIELNSYYWAKKVFNLIGIQNVEYASPNFNINADYVDKFLFKNQLTDLQKADVCLLINCNTRSEGSVLNLHLRNNVQKNNLKVYSIGKTNNLTFPVKNLGLTLQTLCDIVEGRHAFCQILSESKECFIVVGVETYKIKGVDSLLSSLKGKVNLLHNEMSFINFLEVIGKPPLEKKRPLNFLFLYNTDIPKKKLDSLVLSNNVYIVYMGHHFTENASQADLVIPCTTFFEKKASSVNILGMLQTTSASFRDKTALKFYAPHLKNKNAIKSDVRFFRNLYQAVAGLVQTNTMVSETPLVENLYKYLTKNKLQLIDNDRLVNFQNSPVQIKLSTLFKLSKVGILLRNNIFEKYSKILTSSLSNFKKSSNFFL